MPVVSLVVRLS